MLPLVLKQTRMITFKSHCSPEQNLVWSLESKDLNRCTTPYRGKAWDWDSDRPEF